MEIQVEGVPMAVLMRTPGRDLDLAAGFLYTEGVIDGPDDLTALAHVGAPGHDRNIVGVGLAGGVDAHRDAVDRATRELYATSSCGLCGKTAIDRLAVYAPPLASIRELDPAWLAGLPARIQAAQPGFARTGGLHAAALFSEADLMEDLAEDVGRHNAVDKVLGARLRADRAPVDDATLVVTSRAGFEIVQKAIVARVGVVVAVGAATTLAVDLASANRIALYGFVREGRLTRYA